MQDLGTLNGTPTLYVMIGEMRADLKHLQSDVRDVKGRVATLEKRKATLAADLLPYFTGIVVLVLAAAGKWTALGQFLHASAK